MEEGGDEDKELDKGKYSNEESEMILNFLTTYTERMGVDLASISVCHNDDDANANGQRINRRNAPMWQALATLLPRRSKKVTCFLPFVV
jgi:hypothetical protein